MEHWNEPSGAKLIEEKVNQLVDAVNKLTSCVGQLGVEFDNDDTDDIAEVKNENLCIKSMRMGKEFAEEEMERLQKKLNRAMWWLKEIVNNHRFTPITTAENALEELNKKTSVWDIQDYLKSNEDLANFLESALEENDYDFLKIAVNDVITALRKKKENNND